MASALVHDPAVLLLDEPFNGMDPRQRIHLMELLRTMGAEGRTVLFSSHILEEVEQVARQIEVVVAGRHAASGDFGAIRRLMTDRPNRFVLRTARRPADGVGAAGRPVGPRRPAARRGRHRGRGLRLRPVQRGAAAAGPRARRSGCTRSPRPTSRWRASSPTWCRHDVDLSAPVSSPVVSPTIVRLGVRSVFGRRRGILLFVLPVVLRRARRCWSGRWSARTTTPPRPRSTASAWSSSCRWSRCSRRPGCSRPRSTTARSPTCWPSRSRGTRSWPASSLVAFGCVLRVRARSRCCVAGLVLRTDVPAVGVGFAVGSLAGGVAYCAIFALLSVHDPARRGDRADLPAGLGGPARRPARRRPLAERHPLGDRDRRPGRRPVARRRPAARVRRCSRWSSSRPSARGGPAGSCGRST